MSCGDAAACIFGPPTGLIGLTPVTGVGCTVELSDSTHALDQTISPTWSGNHTFVGAGNSIVVQNLVAPLIYARAATSPCGITGHIGSDANTGAVPAYTNFIPANYFNPGDAIRLVAGGNIPGADQIRVRYAGQTVVTTPGGAPISGDFWLQSYFQRPQGTTTDLICTGSVFGAAGTLVQPFSVRLMAVNFGVLQALIIDSVGNSSRYAAYNLEYFKSTV